jgi:hypothetical protein
MNMKKLLTAKRILIFIIGIILSFVAFGQNIQQDMIDQSVHLITHKYYVVGGINEDKLRTCDTCDVNHPRKITSQYSVTQGDTSVYLAPNGTGDGTSWSIPLALNSTNLNANYPAETMIRILRGSTYNGTIALQDDISFCSYSLNNGSKEKPILNGTITLTIWSQLPRDNNIYFAHTAAAGYRNRLLVDGKIVKISSYPSASTLDPYDFWTGYAPMTSVVNTSNYYTDTIVRDNQLPDIDLAGSVAVCRTVGWANYHQQIKRKLNDSTIVLDYGIYGMDKGDPYFIINHPDLIDGNNQWAHRNDTVFVRLADSPVNHTIELSRIDYAFSGNDISNVQINNLEIKNFDKAGINLTGNSENISVSNCYFNGCYNSAIAAYDTDNRNIDFLYNTITKSSYQAVRLQGNNMRVIGNNITKHGLRNNIGTGVYHPLRGNVTNANGAAVGIFVYECDSNLISGNILDSLGYNGVMFAGKHNLIEYNQVQHCDLVLEDGGGFYFHLDCEGSIVRNNISANNGYPQSTQNTFGFYGDITFENGTVESNVAYGNKGYGALFNGPKNVTFENNTIFDNTQLGIRINDYTTVGAEAWVMRNNDFRYNTIFSKTSTSPLYFYTDIPIDSTLRVNLYSNYYCNPYTNSGVPTDYDSHPLSLYAVYETEEVTDTIASLISNSTFDASGAGWFVGSEWTATSPIGTGGALGWARGSAYDVIQTYNFNYAQSGTTKYLLEFDTYSNGDAFTSSSGYIKLGDPVVNFPANNFAAGKDHYRGFATYTGETTQTGRLSLGTTATPGDSIYFDNVYLWEVESQAVNQDTKSQLFVNNTTHPQVQTIGTGTWKDIDGNTVSSLTLQPFSSAILIKHSDNEQN